MLLNHPYSMSKFMSALKEANGDLLEIAKTMKAEKTAALPVTQYQVCGHFLPVGSDSTVTFTRVDSGQICGRVESNGNKSFIRIEPREYILTTRDFKHFDMTRHGIVEWGIDL